MRASGIIFAAGLIIVASVYLILRQLPSRQGGRGIFLQTATAKSDGFIAGKAREDLVGHEGIAITDLRPAGTIRVGNERLDVVSDAGYVAKGTKVRIIRTESYRHVIEPIDEGTGS